jgi:hypothetical protein
MRSVCSPREFVEGYCDPKNFVIDQWCAQNIFQVLDHAGRVLVHSPGISREDLEKMGIVKVQILQEAVDDLMKEQPKAVVIPDGPYVVGQVR